MITILLTLLHIAFCFVLIFVILVQGGRGQGISGPAFGSGNVQTLFGTRGADFMTKATSVSAILFIFTCLGLNMIESHKSKSLLQAGRSTAPVDMEAVRKALEKLKTEVPASATADAQKAANQTAQAVTQTAETAASTVQDAAAPTQTPDASKSAN